MRFVLVLCLLLLPSLVSAQQWNPLSVNSVLPGCRLAKDLVNRAYTVKEASDLSYCQGVVGTLIALGVYLEPEYRFCPPQGAEPGQAIAVIVQALDKTPEKWQMGFHSLALAIIRQAWPCSR
jgi:hypothetical protein